MRTCKYKDHCRLEGASDERRCQWGLVGLQASLCVLARDGINLLEWVFVGVHKIGTPWLWSVVTGCFNTSGRETRKYEIEQTKRLSKAQEY